MYAVDLIAQKLKTFPAAKRGAFLLRRLDEMSYTDIARTLGISEADAKAHVISVINELSHDPELRAAFLAEQPQQERK